MVRADIHIDADSLIRDNRKWSGLRAYVSACSPLCDEKIVTWRQHSTIISVRVRSNPGDFFLFVLAQDKQWIVRIVSRRHHRRVFIADVDRLRERIFRCPSMTPDGKASLDVALSASTRTMHPTIRFLRNILTSQKNGRDGLYLSRPFYKTTFTARSKTKRLVRATLRRALWNRR